MNGCCNNGNVIQLGVLQFHRNRCRLLQVIQREAMHLWYTLFNITYTLSSTGFKCGEFEGHDYLLALGPFWGCGAI